jgi:Na+-translocating ferredoxin:NAD+ oxidoreductase RnfE subunit
MGAAFLGLLGVLALASAAISPLALSIATMLVLFAVVAAAAVHARPEQAVAAQMPHRRDG